MRGFQILLLLAALHLAGGALAAQTPLQDKGRADARLTIAGDRVVGAQIVATFEMGDYEVPEGMYASINVDVMKRPEGGEAGHPDGIPPDAARVQGSGHLRTEVQAQPDQQIQLRRSGRRLASGDDAGP